MDFKKWLLTKIEDIKNKEMNSKNINIIIRTRLSKLSYLKNISNLLLTDHKNLSQINIEELLEIISKYNSHNLDIEEIEKLAVKTQTNTLNDYDQMVYTSLINQILISIKCLNDDIDNLLKDREILVSKYSGPSKYSKLLNKINGKNGLIIEHDILEEMLNDSRISSEDKLSNMEYVLNYNESFIN